MNVDIVAMIDEVKGLLDRQYSPDGFNVGFNNGPAAGQTAPHFHIHVIPRYTGDVVDPRGGVRHVIPAKGNYLAAEAMPCMRCCGAGLAHQLATQGPAIS
jgi:diadenosine tetraphosphate (Ap4A) HIT family hydrolase